MKKMMFWSKNWYFSVQKALIYYTVNKSHHNSFILLVFSHVANFRYVANFRFLTLYRFHSSPPVILSHTKLNRFLENKNGCNLSAKFDFSLNIFYFLTIISLDGILI